MKLCDFIVKNAKIIEILMNSGKFWSFLHKQDFLKITRVRFFFLWKWSQEAEVCSCCIGERIEEHRKLIHLFKNIGIFPHPLWGIRTAFAHPKGGVLTCYTLSSISRQRRDFRGEEERRFLWFCNKVISTQEININDIL